MRKHPLQPTKITLSVPEAVRRQAHEVAIALNTSVSALFSAMVEAKANEHAAVVRFTPEETTLLDAHCAKFGFDSVEAFVCAAVAHFVESPPCPTGSPQLP